MNITNGDILNFPLDSGAILHSCNISGSLENNNLTKQISYRFPSAADLYYDIHSSGNLTLGGFSSCRVPEGLVIALFCEHSNRERNLDYDYLYEASLSVVRYLSSLSNPPKVAIPYKFGCGEANGCWEIVLSIFMAALSSYDGGAHIILNELEWLRSSEAAND